MDSDALKRSGRNLQQGSLDQAAASVQTVASLDSDDPIMPDWGLQPELAAPVSESFLEAFVEDSGSPSAASAASVHSVWGDHYSDPDLMPPGWVRLTHDIRAQKAGLPRDLQGWLLEGQGRQVLADTAWLLTVPDPRETRVFVALSEVEVGPGDLLALGRPWEAAEVENVRCKHLVRGDCFRLTAGEWGHIWLAAFHDRAVFRVLPGSKLGAMLI